MSITWLVNWPSIAALFISMVLRPRRSSILILWICGGLSMFLKWLTEFTKRRSRPSTMHLS